MLEYVKGVTADKADIVDFGNYVFSQAHRPHNFKTLLPKGYADDRDTTSCHYLAKVDGRIRAMVAALPMKQTIAGCELKFGLVGTVSVHPYARGEGHMKRLMRDMIEDQRTQGVDILALGGQRQRYNHFGFERAGLVYSYGLNEASMRHGARDVDAAGIRFAEITREDDPLLDRAAELYANQVVTGARPRDNYLHIMHSWQGNFYAVLRGEDFLGTLYTSGGASLGEILLADEENLPAVLKAWMTEHPGENSLDVAPHEKRRMELIDPLSEGCSIETCEMVCVLNWPRVLQALLNLKALYQPLEDGEACLRVDGQTFVICVRDGKAEVRPTDRTPELELEHLEAERLFFSLSGLCVLPDRRLRNWAPLPYYINRADKF